ncbi:MAG: circularly permuted type 2 ATP-grasp protein [Burkholderiales bacterium]|nr:circularly permuted type 2 ATP-grasp protein [Burkholderiales bacterium]
MPARILAAYPPAAARYDEMLEAPAQPRPHWKPLFDELLATPPKLLRERALEIDRQVRENGVTYNVYADPAGTDRPWDLDLLPQILPHDEWAGIAAAVAQRADLLNRLLADAYGPQRLIADGLLPAALVHGNAGFLRPCHGIVPPGGVYLHVYAADIARAPDGRWWVVADRSQSPSGAGYALENRLAISRAFPHLFRDLRVQPLARFFATLRDSLAQWAPSEGEAPLIVLLTPGPYNETYYEHALLARYLGFPLVEGGDLAVRDGRVWLRTLSGPQRVHAILRRQDDDFCDPLELRSDSALGIPGLTEVVRRGNVLVANSLGSNLIESGAMLGYLPRICEHWLGQPLAMPSVATWWCGEAAALEEVEERLSDLVIKPAYPQLRGEVVFGQDLDGAGRERLLSAMHAHPDRYVAQEMVRISQAPVWGRSEAAHLTAGAVGLRVYACATASGYVVMPGGLTRVATGPDARVISMQRGGGSKDTWVLSQGPVSDFSLIRRAVSAVDLVRSPHNLSSRIAENLFWFGRYAERSDNTARLLRVALGALVDASPERPGREWRPIAALCRSWGLLPAEAATSRDMAEVALRRAVADASVAGLAGCLGQLFRVAFQLRERLSVDNWRTLNRMVQRLARWQQRSPSLAEALSELDQATLSLMTLAGFALDGMTRDQGWRFLTIGRRVERAQFLAAALGHALGEGEDAELEWLLELADSIVTYRSRYMARPQWLPVLDLLIRDETNPRSAAYQLLGLADTLRRLSENFGECGSARVEPLCEALFALRPANDLVPGAPALAAFMQRFGRESWAIAETLEQRFFSHTESDPHALVSP